MTLDNHSLPLVAGKANDLLVRFDKDYPFGPAADAFKEIVATLVPLERPLLFGAVSVSVYDPIALDMAARYAALPDTKFDEADFAKHFPRYVWFPRGGGEPSVYRGSILPWDIVHGLRGFVKSLTGVYFRSSNCSIRLDQLAAEFVRRPDARTEIHSLTEDLEESNTTNMCKYYVGVMDKELKKGPGYFEA